MNPKGNFNFTSFEFLQNQIPDAVLDFTEDSILHNQENLLFLEERYIEENSQFLNITEKLSKKKFNSQLKIYENNNLKEVDDYSQEIELFKLILLENNIDGLSKSDLIVSVKHFENYEQTEKVKLVQNIYILIFLSNVIEYKNNEFVFEVKGDENNTTVKLDDVNTDLIEVYNWIVESKDNLYTRLKIIRELILKKGSFKLNISDLNSAKSMFNRIIKEETDKYFDQINILKDDFLQLSDQKRKSYNSLHIKFLGWISSIGLFVYEQLKDKPSEDLIYNLFFEINDKIRVFLVIFILALIIIWVIFVKEMVDNQEEYEKIKDFYTKKLFLDEKDIIYYLKKPEIRCSYKVIVILLVICFFVRIFV